MNIAIITGASSGLGKEFARRAFFKADIGELWLIARRESNLRELADELRGLKVRVLPYDLSKSESFDELRVLLEAEKPDIRLLINCAGLGKLGDFETIAPAAISAMCDVNMRALTLMTAACIPYMSRGGRIIMVSSIASFAATPRMTVYSATKAYVSALSDGLRYELRAKGISVLTINPSPMDTGFLSVADIVGKSPKFAALPRCNPAKVADQALLDSLRGKSNYTPRLVFKLYRGICKLTPHNLLMSLTRL